jgi:hypothetical protein
MQTLKIGERKNHFKLRQAWWWQRFRLSALKVLKWQRGWLCTQKSSRKHWYMYQSHSHTATTEIWAVVCERYFQITDADSFITCVQMATRVPSCVNYLWLVPAIGRHEHEKSFVSEKACCTSNQISTRPSIQTATCRCYPSVYTVVGFTFYPGYTSEEKRKLPYKLWLVVMCHWYRKENIFFLICQSLWHIEEFQNLTYSKTPHVGNRTSHIFVGKWSSMVHMPITFTKKNIT